MQTLSKRVALGAAVTLLAAIVSAGPVAAQQAAQQQIKRTIFQKSDVPGTNYETVFGMAEIPPNTDFASHTHPGTESSYVVEGELTLNVKGQPTREVKAGQSIFIPAGVAHSGRAGPDGAKIVAAWVVEKGKPLASPAEPFTASAK
jgi:quercetin dioxygenase-like cupin family protein